MSSSGWKHSFAQFSAKYSSDEVDALPWVHDNSDYKQVEPIQLLSSSFGTSCSGCIGLSRVCREKKKLNTYSGSPHQGLPIPGDRDGLDKTLLSILSEDESTRMISEGRGVLSLLINTPRAEQPLRHRATSCAWSPEAAGSLHFLVLDWGMALLHTGGDRTLLGTQPPMPCYIRCTTTRSEKTTMALLSLCL